MSDTDAIDRALEFLDKLERLGEQLKKAEKQEKIFPVSYTHLTLPTTERV